MSAILLLFLFSSLAAQDPVKDDFLRQIPPEMVDTITRKVLPVQPDTVIPGGIKISKDAIDTDITYSAEEIKGDLISGKVVLIDKGKVNYGDIELTADSIELDMETSSVYATGRPDSTGKLAGKPVFKDGSQEFESRELTYNFKTKKAIVKNIRTEQEGGYLNSNTAKLNTDGTIFVDNSKYSTCDKEEPDFYIHLKKAKFYPGEKIVSGPANLVVADIPLPLIIPYGFFPIQTKRASGLIMPSFGQANSRGYYLENGGFYFAINDFSDLKFTGAIYTNGSWRGTIATTYKVRYKYTGSLSFSYSNNISGYKGLETYSKATNYQINWSHSQDSKASPSSRFSARVNMSSSGYDKSNSYNIEDLKTSTRNSSINYSKSWVGTPFNFSTSFNHNQNVTTDVVSVNLPKATLTVSRFYPLKPKNPKKSRWYHDVQLQYTANIDNRINTYDSVLFTNKVWDDMTNGFSHSIPVSIPIKPFANFSISPSLSYSGVAYTQKKEKHWDPDYINPTTNKTVPTVVDSVYRGLYYGHAIVPSISFGYSPSVYGTFQFTNPAAKIQAIRHVIKPSVSFSFTPSFPGLSSDMYRTVQSDTLGHYRSYSIYEGSIYGTPSAPGRSGSVAFNLVNILEAKVFASNDTTGKPKKVKLIDNLSAGTRYDVFADSCNWSDIGARFSTKIAQNVSVSVNSTFNLYAINNAGGKISKFAFSQGQGFARMTSFSLSVDFDLASLINGKKESETTKNKGGANNSLNDINSEENPAEASRYDEFGYVDFDMPWSMNVSYSYMYNKSGWTSSKSNGFTVNGDVKVTPKISLAYSSGYDFVQKELSYTSISIVRDLHCWQMSVSWMPVGPVKFWSFRISPKSGILKDLKYERKKDRYDTY